MDFIASPNLQVKGAIQWSGRRRDVWVLSAILIIAILPVQAAEFEPEQKLKAIKQALVDLAMQKDIKLGSSAYLDGQGVLHETAVMSTQTEVRGVRVVEYLKQAGAPGATLEVGAMSAQSCVGSRPGLRREATIRQIKTDSLVSVDPLIGDHSIGQISELLQKQLRMATVSSEAWSVTNEVEFDSTYSQYLTSRSVDLVPYSLEIKLRRIQKDGLSVSDVSLWIGEGFNTLVEFDHWTPFKFTSSFDTPSWAAVDLEYQLTLIEKATGRELWQGRTELFYPEVKRGYRKSPVPKELIDQIKTNTDVFIKKLSSDMQCHTDHYPLTAGKDENRRTINAGSRAGLRIGDQFLISPLPNVRENAMSLAKMSELRLGQIESVQPHSATLVYVAGPSWEQQSNGDDGFAIYF